MAAAAEVAPEPAPAFAEQAIGRSDEEVTPEMMLVIAAAVTEFLGKKVRILSAKQLQSPRQALSPWSQQGRVFVQASHNLRMG
jgi:methylmalonyl-CoA carboxyltransferase large subunit